MSKMRIYQIRFRLSRSNHYPDVLRAARTLPGFTEGDPNVISLSPEQVSRHIRAFHFIITTAKTWVSAQAYIDDVPLDRFEWSALLMVLHCNLGRERDALPEEYCATGHKFGCRHLYQLRLPDTKLSWRKRYAVAMREVRIRQIDLCPAFSRDMVAQALGADNAEPPPPQEHEEPTLTNEDIWKAINE
jgi:hypothetical protein